MQFVKNLKIPNSFQNNQQKQKFEKIVIFTIKLVLDNTDTLTK